MPKIRRRGLAQAGELPATLKRSSKEAQETFTEAYDGAVRAYGSGRPSRVRRVQAGVREAWRPLDSQAARRSRRLAAAPVGALRRAGSGARCLLAVHRGVLGGQPGPKVVDEHSQHLGVGRGGASGGRGQAHLPGPFGVIPAEQLGGLV